MVMTLLLQFVGSVQACTAAVELSKVHLLLQGCVCII